MDEFDRIRKICKKSGYKESENIGDFWFNNQPILMKKMYGQGVHSTTAPNIMRWKTNFGIKYQQAIKDYIQLKQKENETKINNIVQNSFDDFKKHFSITYAVLDFVDFTIEYDGDNIDANSIPEKLFRKSQTLFDLSGIDFSGFGFHLCRFVNCNMTNVNFDEVQFNNIEFQNCCLNGSSFLRAKLYDVSFIGNSSVIDSDFRNARLQSIQGFSNHSLFHGIRYNTVSYIWLLKNLFLAIFSKRKFGNIKWDFEHTHFAQVKLNDITNLELKSLTEYIRWYQYVNYKIVMHKTFSLGRKIQFALQLISTKYWSSYSIFGIFVLAINLLFSLLIHHNCTSFNNLNDSFFQAFYYSVVTFTTLGYGDISPSDSVGQAIVIIEVLTGYIVLALFIFLISRKIDRTS